MKIKPCCFCNKYTETSVEIKATVANLYDFIFALQCDACQLTLKRKPKETEEHFISRWNRLYDNFCDDYEFTLILNGVDRDTEGLEDDLHNANCGDSILYFKGAITYLEFNRKALSLRDALQSAIKDVKSSNPAIDIISIDFPNKKIDSGYEMDFKISS
jgi:hypothetical protein